MVINVTRLSRLFQGRPESIKDARRFAMAFVRSRVSEDLADLVEVVVSELCTNAVEHTASGEVGGRFVLELELQPEHVQVAVLDMGAPSAPALEDGGALEAECGRGLLIVDAVSKAWGTATLRFGRRVWADVVGVAV